MNEGSFFNITKGGRRFKPGAPEFAAVFDLLPQAALLVDVPAQRIEMLNRAALQLLAVTPEQAQGKHIQEILPGCPPCEPKKGSDPVPTRPRQRKEAESPGISEAGTQGPAGGSMMELVKKDGKRVALKVVTHPLPADDRRLLILLEEQHDQEMQFHGDRRKKFWAELQDLVSAVYQRDVDQTLEKALKAGNTLTGARILGIYLAEPTRPTLRLHAVWGESHLLPEQLPAQDLILLATPHQWATGKRSFTSLHRAARSSRLSFLSSTPLGQLDAGIGLLVAADRERTPREDMLSSLQVVATTVTTIIQHQAQIKELQAGLQEQKRAYEMVERIEEAVQEGLLILTPDLRIRKMNPAAELLLGYIWAEVRGQPVEKILIGTDPVLPALNAAQQGSATYNLGHVRLYRRTGEAFLAHLRTLPVFDNGRLDSILVLIQDLSEQEQVREQSQQLEQRAVLGEVTAIFAHEVRNPINNISTGLQVMAMNLPPGDPGHEQIQRLEQDCDRLAELMKSVLAFSRPADYDMEPVDLGILLQRLLDRLQIRMTRANVQYILQVQPGCPQIEGNPRALDQVFNNLVTNAIQAMGDQGGGQIAIKIHSLNTPEGWPYVEVSVADTGPGIPKEAQEHIFQPFFTTKQNGTGLGLAISKRVVTAHKGNLQVSSFPGGTVFHVQFPAANRE